MKKYDVKELILIGLVAAMSIIVKPYVKTLSLTIVSESHLPVGIVAGIVYMMWLSLIYRLVPKTGTVTLFSIVQIFLSIMIMGMPLPRAITFIPTGIAADMVLKFYKGPELLGNILTGATANTVGSLVMFYMFYGKQSQPLMFIIAIAVISGSLSGFLTQFLVNRLRSFKLVSSI